MEKTQGGAQNGIQGVSATAEKRFVPQTQRKGLQNIRNLILLGVLLAAGIVLKAVNPVNVPGMKPNFVIAMYCLSIMLIEPTLVEGLIIGVLAGVICQFFPGTPYINIVSEAIGAAAMVLLLRVPMKVKKFDLHPIAATFISTLCSGFSFIAVMYLAFYVGADVTPIALGVFMTIIFGTAAINAIIVQALAVPLKLALQGLKG
ncbi:MAG: hypothetical protein LBB86_02750 [Oscillospiraceae bacterium]|jgi:hypothetical protein|nr:hypothetical protein [Oscillospiraceae bacterium]